MLRASSWPKDSGRKSKKTMMAGIRQARPSSAKRKIIHIMTTAIITVFVVGYLFIALESLTKINKAGIAILMGIACWVLLLMGASEYGPAIIDKALKIGILSEESARNIMENYSSYMCRGLFQHYLAEVSETILFLMGAMTVVETVDSHGGFRFVKKALYTPNPKSLLWKVCIMTFFLSATLDNMTTSIVMIMVLKSLISDKELRMKFAGMVIIAANAGGAFSPIGDVTTIMLWIKGCVSTTGIITGIFIPSVICMVVPALIVMFSLKGTIAAPQDEDGSGEDKPVFRSAMRNLVFAIGVGGLVFVPIFHNLTGLPPFMGVLLDLGLLWIVTELVIGYEHKDQDAYEKARISSIISRIDMSTILFFLGILIAVDAVAATGTLETLGEWLNVNVGNIYLVDSIVGVASSIVDNVPLVASAMGMYPIADASMVAADPVMTNYVQDGLFWELLAYCAGTGGSLLIIGSAAGVVVMGLEKISFIWYLKKFTLLAASGYFAGVLYYWFEKSILVGLLQ